MYWTRTLHVDGVVVLAVIQTNLVCAIRRILQDILV